MLFIIVAYYLPEFSINKIMFIENKYAKWYFSIITNAQSRSISPEIKYERHHIIPKSIGGANDPTNLVYLTLHEHILCHRLLVKMLHGDAKYKMKHALFLMAYNSKYQLTSREFVAIKSIKRNHTAETKKKLSIANSGENNPSYGVPCSDARKEKIRETKKHLSIESRAKISAAKKGKGHSQTEETKQKIANSKIGVKRKPRSPEWQAKLTAAHIGRKKPNCSDERKKKISAALTGRKIGPMSAEAKAKLSASKKGKKLCVDPESGKRYMK